MGSGESNLVPHRCKASMLLTELSSESWGWFYDTSGTNAFCLLLTSAPPLWYCRHPLVTASSDEHCISVSRSGQEVTQSLATSLPWIFSSWEAEVWECNSGNHQHYNFTSFQADKFDEHLYLVVTAIIFGTCHRFRVQVPPLSASVHQG